MDITEWLIGLGVRHTAFISDDRRQHIGAWNPAISPFNERGEPVHLTWRYGTLTEHDSEPTNKDLLRDLIDDKIRERHPVFTLADGRFVDETLGSGSAAMQGKHGLPELDLRFAAWPSGELVSAWLHKQLLAGEVAPEKAKAPVAGGAGIGVAEIEQLRARLVEAEAGLARLAEAEAGLARLAGRLAEVEAAAAGSFSAGMIAFAGMRGPGIEHGATPPWLNERVAVLRQGGG